MSTILHYALLCIGAFAGTSLLIVGGYAYFFGKGIKDEDDEP